MKNHSHIENAHCDWLNLPSLNLSVKALFTSYLLVTGLGSMLAMAQILMTHGMADGKFGLSIDDIVYSYHGDPKNSKIEIKLNGSMRDKAPPEERLEIIKWVRKGATKEGWDNKIRDIVYKNCISCHSVIPGLPDFTSYEGIKSVAQRKNRGASVNLLTRISHIHIFAISFIFFFNGLIFSFAVRVRQGVKILLITAPFFFLAIDVFSWWLTKINPGFAWATIIAGIGYGVCSAIVWLVSMYQMWILPTKEHGISMNTWR